MFLNRTDAGEQLAVRLRHLQGKNLLVLAVPRGGVPVAEPVARILHAPLDVVLAKKLGHPMNPEFAIGVATLDGYELEYKQPLPENYLQREVERVQKRLLEMQALYRGGRTMKDVNGKDVIVIDDGVATGQTLLGTLHLLRKQKPTRLIVAIPVAPGSAVARLRKVADEVVCLHTDDDFGGVGEFYEDFHSLEDKEVQRILGGS